MPTRQAASCQQPGWPKTSKQQMWPRTMPRSPNSAAAWLTIGHVTEWGGQELAQQVDVALFLDGPLGHPFGVDIVLDFHAKLAARGLDAVAITGE